MDPFAFEKMLQREQLGKFFNHDIIKVKVTK